MIAHQMQPPTVEGDIADPERADMRLGVEILAVTLAFDDLLRQGLSRTEAAHRLVRQHRHLDGRIFEALVELEPERDQKQTRACSISELVAGMILEQEVRTENGVLIVAKGQEVTPALILKLKNFYEKNAMDGVVTVSLSEESSFSKSAS